MKIFKYLMILIAVNISSCADYIDVVPDDTATIETAFLNEYSARNYLKTCYSELPDAPHENMNPANISGDEVWKNFSYNNRHGLALARGNQNASNPRFDKWESMYKAIRQCNIFLDKIHLTKSLSKNMKKNWIGEVTFLKAYYHYYLVKMYGPVVIADVALPVSVSLEEAMRKRSSVDECFNYIVQLLDEAFNNVALRVPSPSVDLGRITKPIVAAVKAEVLMTAASPFFNGNTDYVDFVTMEGKHFFPQTYNEGLWTQAAEACKVAIKQADSTGVSLYMKDDYRTSYNLADEVLHKVALRTRVAARWNKEIIWGATQSTHELQRCSMFKLTSNVNTNVILQNHNPTLRMAEGYYSENGVPINEDVDYPYENRYNVRRSLEEDKYKVKKGQHTAILHYNRELRFYADLGFDRGMWYGNGNYEPDDEIYVSQRSGGYSASGSSWDVCITGYVPKKLVHLKTELAHPGSLSRYRYSFPLIRLADLYLYYAEALNESKGTPDSEVYKWIDLVRDRAGLKGVVDAWNTHSSSPNKPLTKIGMREIIRQERMIEMSFEGKRFWDLRRWKLARSNMNKPIKGWNVHGSGLRGYYNVTVIETPVFENRHYLWPIKESTLERNTNLIQNPGW